MPHATQRKLEHAVGHVLVGLWANATYAPRPVAGLVGHVRPSINAQLARTPSVNKPSQKLVRSPVPTRVILTSQ